MNQPTIGRIVHYTNLGDKDGKYPPEIQSALITGVYYQAPINPGQTELEVGPGAPANGLGAVPTSSLVDLTVFYRTGYFQCKAMPYSDSPKRGHWNYPPRPPQN